MYRQTDTLYMYIYITTNIFCREYSCPNYFIYKYSYITVYLTKKHQPKPFIKFIFFLKQHNHNNNKPGKQQQKMCSLDSR